MKLINQIHLSFLILLLISSSIDAQNPEQIVRDAQNSINSKIDELHQLARQRDLKNAFLKLDEINSEMNNEITWSTFDEKYREAKQQNPGFTFRINSQLPPQLSADFWAHYETRSRQIMQNQQQIREGMASMLQLNNLDKALAYASQLNTTYETFKNAAENLASANLPKFAYDLYGNMNDFIDNYKKIEKAKLEGIDIAIFEVDLNRMTSKARMSADLYNEYMRYINSNQIAIHDFIANVNYINKFQENANSGPLQPLSYSGNRYNWDYEYHQNEVERICNEFENYEVKCDEFTAEYTSIKTQAHDSWNQVKRNIYSSDDQAKKDEFINYHKDRWQEFLSVINPIYDNTFQIYCVDNSASENEDQSAATTETKEFDFSILLRALKINPQIQSFGGPNFVKGSYEIYFPNDVPGNFGYIHKITLNGEIVKEHNRYKSVFMGYDDKEKIDFDFALPDQFKNTSCLLTVIAKIGGVEYETSTNITITGKTVVQK